MRQLLPSSLDDVDVMAVYAADERPDPGGRPWVVANMISSVDGATAVAGRSGGLGGAADKAAFDAIRAVADVILVGAGTARAERYRPPTVSDRALELRRARGQTERPRLAVVSGRLALDTSLDLFASGEPFVITHASADPDRRESLGRVADVVIAGDEHVDLRGALEALYERGVRVVVCEGGPTLNGQLAQVGLIDELCLTTAPLLVGGTSHRIIELGEALVPPSHLTVARVLEQDGYVLARYVFDRS